MSAVCTEPGVGNCAFSFWVHKRITPLMCGGVTDSEISHTLYTGWKHTMCRCLVLSQGSVATGLPASFPDALSPPLTAVALPHQPSLFISWTAYVGCRQGSVVCNGEVRHASGDLKKDKNARKTMFSNTVQEDCRAPPPQSRWPALTETLALIRNTL